MAQADLNVANQSGSAFRADLNNQLLALGTLMSGASEPSTTYAYMLWADTTADVLKMRNAANNGWIILRGLEGKLSVGSSAPGANVNLRLNRDIAGASTSFGQYVDAQVAASVTGSAIGVGTSIGTAASTSLGSLIHYQAATGTLGAGTSITNQIGFSASSSIDGATNDFGFYGNIAAGSGNWNCYMVGAAPSFFNHQVQINAGSVSAPSVSTNGDTNTGIYFPAADTIGFVEGGVEAARITSAGLVGIGTSSPGALLEVSNTSGGTIRLGRADSDVTTDDIFGELDFYSNDGDRVAPGTQKAAFIRAAAEEVFGRNTYLAFGTNSTGVAVQERVRIDSLGRVGIGTTSPTDAQLYVNSSSLYGVRINHATLPLQSFLVNGTQSFAIGANSGGGGSFYYGAGNVEAARIDSSGRLLVGTSSSTAGRFVVSTTTGTATMVSRQDVDSGFDESFTFIRAGASGGDVSNSVPLGILTWKGVASGSAYTAATIQAQVDGTPGANNMPGRIVLSTTASGASSPTERMRIAQNGNIFTFSAFHSLTLGNVNTAGTNYYFVEAFHSRDSATTGGTRSFAVWTNGNVVNTNNSYGAISDLKLKENIVDATSQWSDIKALQVRKYNFKKGQTHTQIGLIAQEVELVSPGLVSESPDRDEDGNDLGTVTKSVNYSVLYMKAVKALQEAMERIETLEAKVAALESA